MKQIVRIDPADKIGVVLRYSDDKQKDGLSFEYQLKSVGDFLTKHNRSIDEAKIYEDPAQTAYRKDFTNRAGLMNALRDAEEGRIDVLILYSRNRLARNNYDAQIINANLKKWGVRLYYSNDIQPAEDGDNLVIDSILYAFAQFESDMTSTRVSSAIKAKVDAGKFPKGPVPFGYFKSGEFIKQKFEEAYIVKRIFDFFELGLTYEQISQRLFKNNLSEYRWEKWQVADILQNPIYAGFLLNEPQKAMNIRYKLPRNEPQIVKSPFIEQIIDDVQWENCQLIRNVKMKQPNFFSTQYMLKDFLYCHCGTLMIAKDYSRKGYTYKYYRCPNCKDKIDKEAAEKSFKELFVNIDRNKVNTNLNKEISIQLENSEKLIAAIRSEIARLENSIGNVEQQLQRIYKRNGTEISKTDLDLSNVLVDRMKQLEDKTGNLAKHLEENKKLNQRLKSLNPDLVEKSLDSICNSVENDTMVIRLRLLLSGFKIVAETEISLNISVNSSLQGPVAYLLPKAM